MYYPPHRDDVITAAETAAVEADEEGSFVTFTDSFKYLGSRIDCDLCDKHDVCSRIKSATGAFGALRKSIFENKHISFQIKKVVYVTLIINIALYGADGVLAPDRGSAGTTAVIPSPLYQGHVRRHAVACMATPHPQRGASKPAKT